MDIYIYGAGRRCGMLIERLKEYKDIHIGGLADSFSSGKRYGLELFDIFSTDEVKLNIPVVISVGNIQETVRIKKRLQEFGFTNIYWFWGKTKSFIGDFFKGECINLSDYKDGVILPSLELHVSDYCNLNCAGCVHYSPLFDRVNPEFKTRIMDLKTISGLIDHVIMLSLLGGEPLVNPELIRYIEEARRIFQGAGIQLITNGLLIPQIDDECFVALRENNISVVISEYEPTHNIIKRIREKLDGARVDYSIRPYDNKQKFNRPLSIAKQTSHDLLCICDGCIGVCDGKIARCPALLYIDKFNEIFHQNLPNKGIYLISEFNDGVSLINKMGERVPLCDYCIRDEMVWHRCNKPPKITDFAAMD